MKILRYIIYLIAVLFASEAIIGCIMLPLNHNAQVILAHLNGCVTMLIGIIVVCVLHMTKQVLRRSSHKFSLFAINFAMWANIFMIFMYFLYIYFNLEAVDFPLSSYGFDIATSLSFYKDINFCTILLTLVPLLLEKQKNE